MLGLPAVVLDVNNDLSRLGEPGLPGPKVFRTTMQAKAKAYQERAEVVIWDAGHQQRQPALAESSARFRRDRRRSRRRDGGRARPGDRVALATLDPPLCGSGRKAVLKRGVLADALRAFALAGGGSLDELILRLADFDADESKITDAAKLAAEMADQLNAMIAADPLLRAEWAGPRSGAAVFGLDRQDADLGHQSRWFGQRRGQAGVRQPIADGFVHLDQTEPEPDRPSLRARRGAEFRALANRRRLQAQRVGAGLTGRANTGSA